MATIVLGALGRAVGGPLGGIVGTLAGGFVDRAVFAGGRVRDVGRLASPVVQSSAYGEAMPFVYGRMRVAGNVIWSSGIDEAVDASGGGKGGPATNQYRYSASFAVGLAAREIVGIGRVWGDGRLIRDAQGMWSLPVQMRVHSGSERQEADPLIVAAEGGGGAPAYRGLAYVVFEDLSLADFGNRIPNLSFEIVADAGEGLDFGGAATALVGKAAAAQGGAAPLLNRGAFSALAGFVAARPGALSGNIQPIVDAMRAAVIEADGSLCLQRLSAEDVPDVTLDAAMEGQASVERADGRNDGRSGSGSGALDRQMLAGGDGPDSFEIGHYAVDRDYLAGLQRVRRSAGQRVAQLVLPVAMDAGNAKALAADLLVGSRAGRLTRVVRLPWQYLDLLPGMVVRLAGSDALWRIREQRFEAFVVSLSLERVGSVGAAAMAGDSGRRQAFDDGPAGETQLVAVELPGLGGAVATAPRVQVFAAGASPRWRRAGVELSQDGGASYALAGAVTLPCVMGALTSPLSGGATASWDRHGVLDVELLSDAMWMESASPSAVLQGTNLALVGSELLQFADVEAIGPRRFRLKTLLRGRFGTEAAAISHAPGQSFLLVRPGFPVEIDVPLDAIGRALEVRAAGVGDDGASIASIVVSGRALKPLSPAHLTLRREGDDLAVIWKRRSRTGFAWLDFVDAPLGEEVERYEVCVRLDGAVRRRVEVISTSFFYSQAACQADGGGVAVELDVAQISAAVGPGEAATAAIVMD